MGVVNGWGRCCAPAADSAAIVEASFPPCPTPLGTHANPLPSPPTPHFSLSLSQVSLATCLQPPPAPSAPPSISSSAFGCLAQCLATLLLKTLMISVLAKPSSAWDTGDLSVLPEALLLGSFFFLPQGGHLGSLVSATGRVVPCEQGLLPPCPPSPLPLASSDTQASARPESFSKLCHFKLCGLGRFA